MGQVTIYLEETVEKKMVAAAKSAQLSKSKWISRVIEEKVASEWPQSVVQMAGAWENFPDLESLRESLAQDAERATL